MKQCKLKDSKKIYIVNKKTNEIEQGILMKCSFYPLGFGYIKVSDNNLYVLNKSHLENMYETMEEAEDSLHDLFMVMA